MKLQEITEGRDFAQHNDLDKQGKPMKLPNFLKDKDIGAKTTVTPRTVLIKDTKTGNIYGRRTIHSK